VFAAVNIEFLFAQPHSARRAAVRQRQFRRHDGDAKLGRKMPVGYAEHGGKCCVSLSVRKTIARTSHFGLLSMGHTGGGCYPLFNRFVLFSLRDTYTHVQNKDSLFVAQRKKSFKVDIYLF